jgi:hypothetical protein
LISPTPSQQELADQREENDKDRILTQKQSHFDSHLHGVYEEPVEKHLDTYKNSTAGACSINSEVDNKDIAVTPAEPLDDGVLTHCVTKRQQKSILIPTTPAQRGLAVLTVR